VKCDDLISSLLMSGNQPVVLEDELERKCAFDYVKTNLEMQERENNSELDPEFFPAAEQREYLLRESYNRCYVSINNSVVRFATSKHHK
jgi:hypothetical protein